jgi:hypothetical protein
MARVRELLQCKRAAFERDSLVKKTSKYQSASLLFLRRLDGAAALVVAVLVGFEELLPAVGADTPESML